jgi:hypothetical protein
MSMLSGNVRTLFSLQAVQQCQALHGVMVQAAGPRARTGCPLHRLLPREEHSTQPLSRRGVYPSACWRSWPPTKLPSASANGLPTGALRDSSLLTQHLSGTASGGQFTCPKP